MSKAIIRSIRFTEEEKKDLDLLANHKSLKFSKIVHEAIGYYIAREYDLIKMIKDKEKGE